MWFPPHWHKLPLDLLDLVAEYIGSGVLLEAARSWQRTEEFTIALDNSGTQMRWSSDGAMLLNGLSTYHDPVLRIQISQNGSLESVLRFHDAKEICVPKTTPAHLCGLTAWSPAGDAYFVSSFYQKLYPVFYIGELDRTTARGCESLSLCSKEDVSLQAANIAKWSPDGRYVAAVTMDSRLRLWTRQGVLQWTYILGWPFCDLKWNAQSTQLLVCSHTSILVFVTHSVEPVAECRDTAITAEWQQNGSLVSYVCHDGSFYLWRPTLDLVSTLCVRFQWPHPKLFWRASGDMFAAMGSKVVQLFQFQDDRVQKVGVEIPFSIISEFLVKWSPCGSFLAISTDAYSISVFNTQGAVVSRIVNDSPHDDYHSLIALDWRPTPNLISVELALVRSTMTQRDKARGKVQIWRLAACGQEHDYKVRPYKALTASLERALAETPRAHVNKTTCIVNFLFFVLFVAILLIYRLFLRL